MPDLLQVLRDYDLGLLTTIAELWGVELAATHPRAAAEELAGQLRRPEAAAEMVNALAPESRAALAALRRARQPLAQYMRRHGELRAMGPARRDREQPWRNDPSPVEVLWYRALIARGFFDEGTGPQEFAFIPDDLAPLIPAGEANPERGAPPGQPLVPPPAHSTSARQAAAADAATLLSYLQIASIKLEGAAFPPKHREALARFLRLPEALDFLAHLVIHLNLAGSTPLKPDPSHARPFLESSFPQQAQALASAWRESTEWIDLFHVPGLIFEGQSIHIDPARTREAILALLAEVPAGQWWSLDSFVVAVHDRQPDFQRPAGDYTSWLVRDSATQADLRGFDHWHRVDGALVRWMIEQPLYWLGMVDLAPLSHPASGARGEGLPGFRLTPSGAAFLGLAPWPEAEEPVPVKITSNGPVRVPAAASRYDRFQIARVTHWVALEKDTYIYRLTPASLDRAGQQGIKVTHIVASLQKAVGEAELPPLLLGALKRWERAGAEAAVTELAVLKVKSPDLLETLRRTPRVKRYLGDNLGPAAVEVRKADMDRLREALEELGILVD